MKKLSLVLNLVTVFASKRDTIRSMSRMAAGVKGVTLRDGDQVVGAAAITENQKS